MCVILRWTAMASLLWASWAAPLPARAAPATGHTYTVNSTLDERDSDPSDGVCSSAPSGVCSLRAAIQESNFAPGPNTILLPAGTYTLTRPGYHDDALVGDLDIGHDVTIQGAGSATTNVDGNGAVTGDRVFQILSTTQGVTLRGMTIRNGHAADPASSQSGGGIDDEGTAALQLSDVILEGNTAVYGGGLLADNRSAGQSVRIYHSKVYSNTATQLGGGLYVGSVLTFSASQLYSNTAGFDGGGIWTDTSGYTEVVDSILSGNAAGRDGGGVISIRSGTTLVNSTLSGNTASKDGGGFYASFGLTRLINSTLSGNVADEAGGGLYAYGAQTQLLNATIASNTAHYHVAIQPGLGGGLYLTHTATLTAKNSIIANNKRISYKGPQAPDDCSSVDTTGSIYYNLFTTLANCSFSFVVQNSNIVSQDPLLGPLQDNGGATPTEALLPGSPAIDAGDPGGCSDGTGGLLTTGQWLRYWRV